ncbi:MAG: ImmA/IrrE family metallo-endopeptidase [Pirellulales bacterium]|nr:ImmA/IrrE family metallo-endopeptidase [Pirellulales bacterium]
MLSHAPDKVTAILDEAVSEALTFAAIEQPPVDAFQVARALGLAVLEDSGQRPRARLVRVADPRGGPSRPSIVLSAEPRGERRQWAVAHEIGEHLAGRCFEQLNWSVDDVPLDTRESLANQLARRLLLPSEWFARDAANDDWELPLLKQRYATASHELIAWRTLDLPEPAIVTVFDHGRVTWRRTNLAGRAPLMSAVEQAAWRFAHKQGAIYRTREHGARIVAWPIHELDWRREIVRCDTAAFEFP